jgi:sortase A
VTAQPATGTPTDPVVRPPRRRTAGDVVRTVLRGIGQTLITIGVVLLLFCVYELKVTNLVTEREQEQLQEEIERAWAAPAPTPPPGSPPPPVELGTGIAVLRIPVLDDGADDPFAKVVVEGTSLADLKKGPGRIRESQQPGELGNLVISGHRTTYGAPFADLDRLRPGDAVVVETRDTWFTYRVTGTRIVSPTAVEVTLPVPGQPGVAPTESVLTLTTCHPRYSARQRMVVSAALDETLAKVDGDPPALRGA